MKKKILICSAICIFCLAAIYTFYQSAYDQDSSFNTTITNKVINESEEKNTIISKLKEATKPKKQIQEEVIEPEPTPVQTYTEDELYMMSHLIMGEAGGQSRECKIAVGSVVLNRVKSDRFPKTNDIKSVIFAKGQYACTWDGNYNKTPNEESIEVAKFLLENGSQLPEYVIFQSRGRQGNATYKVIDGEYFCYYKEDVK